MEKERKFFEGFAGKRPTWTMTRGRDRFDVSGDSLSVLLMVGSLFWCSDCTK
jgi:hypothetical protein